MKTLLSGLIAALLITGLLYAQNTGLAPYPVYGHTYVADGVASVTVTASYVMLTQFTTATAQGVTWDAGGDYATVSKAGLYDISFNVSFTGTDGKVYDCAVFGGASGTTELNQVHTTTIWKSVEGFMTEGARGLVTLAANDILSVKCHGAAAGDVMVVQDGSFTLIKIG
jgi:hypothetical protein